MRKLRVVQVGTEHDHACGPYFTVKHMPEKFEIIGIIEEKEDPVHQCGNFFKEPPADLPPYITWEKAFEMKPDAFLIETCELDLVENAIRALEAGYHVYIDKPGSAESERFHYMCNLAKEKGLVLCFGYMYRYNPSVLHAKQLMDEGKLGEIFSVEAQMSVRHQNTKRAWLSRFEGGMTYFLGCHLIDLVAMFCGFPEEVIPMNCNTGVDGNDSVDFGFCAYKYKNGYSFIKSCATEINGYERRQLVICGSLGTIEITPFERNLEGGYINSEYRETLNNDVPWNDNSTTVVSDPYFRYDKMFESFYNYVCGTEKNPYTYDYEAKLHDLILASCK
ncbi:MAG: Gfo/Idh/MocA family oxidoreductase [Clostridia bacterium]|nr:Gfo/Idh/MocA family oxidoreductase [Clostridia bacterium]